MAKKKIEIRKPQYVVAKETKDAGVKAVSGIGMPLFFRLLMFSAYACSGIAILTIWHAFQKLSVHS